MNRKRLAVTVMALSVCLWDCSDEGITPPSDGGSDSAKKDGQNLNKDAKTVDGIKSDGKKAPDGSTGDGTGSDGSKVDSGGAKVDSGGAKVDSSGAKVDSSQPDAMLPDLVPPDKGIPAVVITTTPPLPAGIVNKTYKVTFSALGGLGTGTYKWTGSGVAWGAMNKTTGVFSGIPTAPGTFTLTVRVDSGTVFYQKTFKIEVVTELVIAGAAKPYLQTTCAAGKTISLKSLFSGGKGPYTCYFYVGNGAGTRPSKLTYATSDPTGCTLIGGFDATKDLPGAYGFLVSVKDAVGQVKEIPIACKNGDCPTTPANVTMTPAIWPPAVKTGSLSYTWKAEAKDVNVPCKDAKCTSCGWCMNILMNTAAALTGCPSLDCTKTGHVCLDNSVLGSISKCPDVTTWKGEPRVKAHSPQRGAGLPAWATLELNLVYSGNVLSPCGGKKWICHWETLEQ